MIEHWQVAGEMMRVALFSDIHGHITGLQAVMARLKQLGGADVTYALGDYVGGGPGLDDLLDLLLEQQVRMVRGNWDEKFTNPDAQLAQFDASADPDVGRTYEWVMSRLSRGYQRLLANLPLDDTLELSPTQKLYLCHAAPGNPWAKVCQPDTPVVLLQQTYGEVDATIIAYGHYHAHHVVHLDGKVLINVAAVGLGWEGLSTLTLLEVRDEVVTVQQYQVPFDMTERNRLIKERHMPHHPAIWYW